MKQYLTSKWLIALILTIPLLILLPKKTFKKYSVEFVKEVHVGIVGGTKNYFEDLNGDGTHERITSLEYLDHLSFIVFDDKNQMVGQTNFKGEILEKVNELFFYDTNHNDLIEIYGFTTHDDSLFLNSFEALSGDAEIKEFFVSKVGTYEDGKFDIQITQVKCLDLNNDGTQEIVFVLHNGFSKYPRRIIVLHPESGVLETSESIGATLNYLQFVDIDEDARFEIICGSRATNNFAENENVNFKDNSTWLIAFDDDLTMLFNPVKIQTGIGSKFLPFIYETDFKEKYIVGLAHSVAPQNKCCLLYKFSSTGDLIDSLVLNFEDKNYALWAEKINNNFILAQLSRDKVQYINIHSGKIIELPLLLGKDLFWRHSVILGRNADLVHCAWEEGNRNLHLFSDDFKHHNEIIVDEAFDRSQSVKKFNGDNANIEVTLKNRTVFYLYKRNHLYELKYLLWLGIYLLITLIVFVIQKLQENRIREKYELQNKVRELQLATFRNQLHPHFIFNTFNSIISVVMQGRKEEAYDLFSSFMKVLRSSLNNTESVLVSLEDELSLVKNFVEIQQFRFKDLFEFTLKVDDRVSMKSLIPKMIIQIHVENAIKHGLRLKGSGGLLEINIQINNKRNLIIEIKDNGIGRQKAKELETGGSGLGLKTIDEFIKQVNAGKKIQVKQEIVDLAKEDDGVDGTKVVVVITYRTSR